MNPSLAKKKEVNPTTEAPLILSYQYPRRGDEGLRAHSIEKNHAKDSLTTLIH